MTEKLCKNCPLIIQKELENTIKKAMSTLPSGEHFHVAGIIFEQNALICRLKAKMKRNKKGNNKKLTKKQKLERLVGRSVTQTQGVRR
jgi:hypothetical protein